MLNLCKDPNVLSEKETATSVRQTTLLIIFIALCIIKGLVWFLGAEIDMEDPMYFIQQSMRVSVSGLTMGLLRSIAVLTIGLIGSQLIETSQFGQRQSNKTTLYGAILIATALAFIR